MRIKRLEDARSRTLAGIVAVVAAPAIVISGGIGGAAYAIHRAVTEPEVVCVPEKVAAPLQDSFPVNVYNAGPKSGAAGTVAAELPLRRFRPGTVGNDPVDKRVTGVGELRYGPAGRDQALVVKALLLPDAKLAPDYREDTSVDLVLGPDFAQLKAPDGPLVYRSDVVVNVYNTTYYEGLGAKTADGLAALGFTKGVVGTDPQGSWVTDVAVIRHSPDAKLAADLLAEAVPGARLQQDDAAKRGTVDLLLGMTFTALAPADKLTPQPPKKPLAPITVERPCHAGR